VEGLAYFFARDSAPLDEPLVQQAVPAELLAGTRRMLQTAAPQPPGEWRNWLAQHSNALKQASAADAVLVAGSGAGAPLVFHGPSLHGELALWIQAGIAPPDALRAATWNAAALLGASGRIGAIRPGYEANLVLVDGNPLQDPGALDRIAEVILKGERLDRETLVRQ
jgi:imidazolonepropionase-like amidohydrolase